MIGVATHPTPSSSSRYQRRQLRETEMRGHAGSRMASDSPRQGVPDDQNPLAVPALQGPPLGTGTLTLRQFVRLKMTWFSIFGPCTGTVLGKDGTGVNSSVHKAWVTLGYIAGPADRGTILFPGSAIDRAEGIFQCSKVLCTRPALSALTAARPVELLGLYRR